MNEPTNNQMSDRRRWLIRLQPIRLYSRWRQHAVEVSNAVEMMRAVDELRQGRRVIDGHAHPYTLYTLVAADLPFVDDPFVRWSAELPKDEHEAMKERLTEFLRAPERVGFAYRVVFDLDPRDKSCWSFTRDAALRLQEAFREVAGDARLDAYASGGKKAGLHLEAPSDLIAPCSAGAVQLFVRELATRAKVALLVDREDDDEKSEVEVDDSILGVYERRTNTYKGAVPCTKVLQAPGVRYERVKDEHGELPREPVVSGTGKVFLPWEVIEKLTTPEAYEIEVAARMSAGQLVPEWLTQGSSPEMIQSVRSIPTEVFEPFLEKASGYEETRKNLEEQWAKPKPKTTKPKKNEEDDQDDEIRTEDALKNLREGCQLLAECWEKQERGERLDLIVWRGFGSILVKLGKVGIDELRRLDQLAMKDDFDESKFEAFISNAPLPFKCSTLCQRMKKESLGCGTLNDPCNFDPGASPYSHAANCVRAEMPPDDRVPLDEVRGRLAKGIEEFLLGDVPARLVRSETGTGKTYAIEVGVEKTGARRFAYLGPLHDLLDQEEKNLRDRGVDAVKRPKPNAGNCDEGEHDTIQEQYDAGLDPYVLTCRDCKYLRDQTCRYRQEVARVPNARVALFTSAMLMQKERFFEQLAGRALIVDEDPTQWIAPMRNYTTDDLERKIEQYQRAHAHTHDPEACAYLAERIEVWKTFRDLIDRTKNEEKKLRLLLGKDMPVAALRLSGRPWKEVNQALLFAPFASYGREKMKGKLSAETAFLDNFLEFAASEPNTRVGIVDWIEGRDHETEEVKGTLSLQYRVRIPKLRLLVLDATALRFHYKKVFERDDFDEVEGRALHNSTLIQLVDESFGITKMGNPEVLADCMKIVDGILKEHGFDPENPGEEKKRPGLISFDKHAERIEAKLPKGVRFQNFWGTRGLNELGEASIGVVLGTPRVPVAKIRALAALLYDAPEHELLDGANQYKRFYRGRTIRTYAYREPTMILASRYFIHSELCQAIGRFRYTHGGKTVYILSNEILDIAGIEARFARPKYIERKPLPQTRRKDAEENLKILIAKCHELLLEGVLNQGSLTDRSGLSLSTVKRHWSDLASLFQLRQEGRYYRGALPPNEAPDPNDTSSV